MKVYVSDTNTTAERVLQDIKREISEEESTSKLIHMTVPGDDLWPWLTQFQHRMTELLYIGGNRRGLIIACFLQGLQQLCGFVCPPFISW